MKGIDRQKGTFVLPIAFVIYANLLFEQGKYGDEQNRFINSLELFETDKKVLV